MAESGTAMSSQADSGDKKREKPLPKPGHPFLGQLSRSGFFARGSKPSKRHKSTVPRTWKQRLGDLVDKMLVLRFGSFEPLTLLDFELLAKKRTHPRPWASMAGSPGSEMTLQRNRTAFDRVTVNPRYLVDVNDRDLSSEVLGQPVQFPLIAGMPSGQGLMHPHGELASAAAASKAGVVYPLVHSTSYPIEEVAGIATCPLWLALTHYNREATEILVRRAEDAGFRALCLNVDTPVSFSTERREWRKGLPLRQGLLWFRNPLYSNLRDRPDLQPGWAPLSVESSLDWTPDRFVGLAWPDLEWLRSLTQMRIVLKGIMTTEDAQVALDHGVDAMMVSNHGGRSGDGLRSAIEVLPEVVDVVNGRAEVYLDSGIRRGVDIFRALALGATAVGIGRPLLWGLIVDGEIGVRKVFAILREELDRTMARCGCRSIREITRAHVTVEGLPNARGG